MEICGNCLLNLTGEVEGCQTIIKDLDPFLSAVSVAKPDSILLSLPATPLYERDALEVLVKELQSIASDLAGITWYGAHPFAYAQPVVNEKGEPVIHPWSGDPQGYYFFSNAAYSVGVSTEGILLRDLAGGGSPAVFSSLFRHGSSIMGKSPDGDMIDLTPDGGILPAWESTPQEISELRHVKLPASEMFAVVHGILTLFAEKAYNERTAFMIEEVY